MAVHAPQGAADLGLEVRAGEPIVVQRQRQPGQHRQASHLEGFAEAFLERERQRGGGIRSGGEGQVVGFVRGPGVDAPGEQAAKLGAEDAGDLVFAEQHGQIGCLARGIGGDDAAEFEEAVGVRLMQQPEFHDVDLVASEIDVGAVDAEFRPAAGGEFALVQEEFGPAVAAVEREGGLGIPQLEGAGGGFPEDCIEFRDRIAVEAEECRRTIRRGLPPCAADYGVAQGKPAILDDHLFAFHGFPEKSHRVQMRLDAAQGEISEGVSIRPIQFQGTGHRGGGIDAELGKFSSGSGGGGGFSHQLFAEWLAVGIGEQEARRGESQQEQDQGSGNLDDPRTPHFALLLLVRLMAPAFALAHPHRLGAVGARHQLAVFHGILGRPVFQPVHHVIDGMAVRFGRGRHLWRIRVGWRWRAAQSAVPVWTSGGVEKFDMDQEDDRRGDVLRTLGLE